MISRNDDILFTTALNLKSGSIDEERDLCKIQGPGLVGSPMYFRLINRIMKLKRSLYLLHVTDPVIHAQAMFCPYL